MGFMENLRSKYELYKLEQRYTRRDKRTTFCSGAQYVDGEYVYSPTTSTKSGSSFGSAGGSKRMSTIHVKEIFTGNNGNKRATRVAFTQSDLNNSANCCPFMHNRRGLAHATCTARNAYNPLLALASTLVSAQDLALTQPLRGARQIKSRTAASGLQSRSFVATYRTRDAQATRSDDGDAEKQSVQEEKPRTKGTFAGYHALMGFGDDAPRQSNGASREQVHKRDRSTDAGARSQQQPRAGLSLVPDHLETAPDGKGKSGFRISRPVAMKALRKRSEQRSSKRDKALARTGSKPPYDWKAHMHRIAERANTLAQDRRNLTPQELKFEKEKMDYRATPLHAEPSPLEEGVAFPWVQRLEGVRHNGLHQLNREINDFYKFMVPQAYELSARRAVRLQLESFVREHAGDTISTELFGSSTNNLLSATSDLDFRVFLQEKPSDVSREAIFEIFGKMKRLREELDESPDWILAVLRNARYPIINVQHRLTGIDVQIVASPSTAPQLEVTKQYLRAIPNLQKVYFVVKTMLGMRDLDDVFNGGTGSYGLLMMLVASLTRRGAQRLDAEPSNAFLDFLDFWCEHDHIKYGVALRPPDATTPPMSKLFLKHDAESIPRHSYIQRAYAREDRVRAGQWSIGQARPFQPYLPCIQDPANPLNDLGRKMNAIKYITATFDNVRAQIRRNTALVNQGKFPQAASTLYPAVGRCHEVYAERRRRISEYGRDVRERMSESGQVPAQREAHRKERDLFESRDEEKMERARSQLPEHRREPVESAWAG